MAHGSSDWKDGVVAAEEPVQGGGAFETSANLQAGRRTATNAASVVIKYATVGHPAAGGGARACATRPVCRS